MSWKKNVIKKKISFTPRIRKQKSHHLIVFIRSFYIKQYSYFFLSPKCAISHVAVNSFYFASSCSLLLIAYFNSWYWNDFYDMQHFGCVTERKFSFSVNAEWGSNKCLLSFFLFFLKSRTVFFSRSQVMGIFFVVSGTRKSYEWNINGMTSTHLH